MILFGLRNYHRHPYIHSFLTTEIKDLSKIYELARIDFFKDLRAYRDQFYASSKCRDTSILWIHIDIKYCSTYRYRIDLALPEPQVPDAEDTAIDGGPATAKRK
jgi:hypothetical protein